MKPFLPSALSSNYQSHNLTLGEFSVFLYQMNVTVSVFSLPTPGKTAHACNLRRQRQED
jgi:hypothetical protein